VAFNQKENDISKCRHSERSRGIHLMQGDVATALDMTIF
jgi:hypothetical protein